MGKRFVNGTSEKDMRAKWNSVWSPDQKEQILVQAGISPEYKSKSWAMLEEGKKRQIITAAKELGYIQ